jgi:hypothetical protein
MGENENRNGRRVIVMPTVSSDRLRGSSRDIALKNEAVVLRDAIVGALDVLDLFDEGGRVVLVANGELQMVNADYLRTILESLFATKAVVRKIGVTGRFEHVVELKPIQPSELAVRALLTKEPKDGGLAGLLPVLQIETQGFATAPVAPAEKPPIETNPVEHAAGRAAVARHAASAERTRLEIARGAEVVERHRQGRQTAVEPTPLVEEYPVFIEGQQPPPQEV